ncbi:Homeodomain-like domain-containing protein [Stackebrandtia endophytica]|uniref:Homeodomain-like domain-containing protein n=1 Tax=Stackebrandtia endophytica TaxID=1496996 RepID=A0A543AY02_9ACTN|nr:helix-turn-helix domain-containing protein [Stackebrandtia endophytica]TQL77459.1 Homeodomain-like domain-containing protein [Stackebrandtia endophytica]
MKLTALGISPEPERAYRALVVGGPADAPMLANALDTDSDHAQKLLDELTQTGLASPESGRYRAAPPEIALRALLVRRRDELGHAEAALAELAELFRSQGDAGSIRDLIEVVTGAEGVRQRFLQIQSAATKDLRAFVKPQPILISAQENPAEGEALARGVTYRVVLERALLEQPGMLGNVADTLAAGEQVRATNLLPLRMMIADGQIGLVPLAESGEPGAVVVHPSGLLDALIGLFELVWQQAAEVFEANDDGAPPGLDERIVALLLQGFPDKAIAKQLEVSPRTVQRRIKLMMDTANAHTRVQLGYWLARHSVAPTSETRD